MKVCFTTRYALSYLLETLPQPSDLLTGQFQTHNDSMKIRLRLLECMIKVPPLRFFEVTARKAHQEC